VDFVNTVEHVHWRDNQASRDHFTIVIFLNTYETLDLRTTGWKGRFNNCEITNPIFRLLPVLSPEILEFGSNIYRHTTDVSNTPIFLITEKQPPLVSHLVKKNLSFSVFVIKFWCTVAVNAKKFPIKSSPVFCCSIHSAHLFSSVLNQ